jgi:hypothetical protein
MKTLIKFVNEHKFEVEVFVDTFTISLYGVTFNCRKTLTKEEMRSLLKFFSNQDSSYCEIEFLNPDISDEDTLSPETNLMVKRVMCKYQPLYVFIFYKKLMIGTVCKEFTLNQNNSNEIFNTTVKYFL